MYDNILKFIVFTKSKNFIAVILFFDLKDY